MMWVSSYILVGELDREGEVPDKGVPVSWQPGRCCTLMQFVRVNASFPPLFDAVSETVNYRGGVRVHRVLDPSFAHS